MLKKTVTYTDYNGVERTEDFYFNLTRSELMEMHLTTEGGMDEKINSIIKAKSQRELEKLFKEIENPHCAGLSLLGGDPLSVLSANRKTVIALCKEFKEKFPGKNICLWTGYTIDEIRKSDEMKEVVKYVDVIIDGPFVESLKDINLKWRGSSNQNIIYTKDLKVK